MEVNVFKAFYCNIWYTDDLLNIKYGFFHHKKMLPTSSVNFFFLVYEKQLVVTYEYRTRNLPNDLGHRHEINFLHWQKHTIYLSDHFICFQANWKRVSLFRFVNFGKLCIFWTSRNVLSSRRWCIVHVGTRTLTSIESDPRHKFCVEINLKICLPYHLFLLIV